MVFDFLWKDEFGGGVGIAMMRGGGGGGLESASFGMAMADSANSLMSKSAPGSSQSTDSTVEKVRKFFPESWLFDLVLIGWARHGLEKSLQSVCKL